MRNYCPYVEKNEKKQKYKYIIVKMELFFFFFVYVARRLIDVQGYEQKIVTHKRYKNEYKDYLLVIIE
jgi:hypothetical protein